MGYAGPMSRSKRIAGLIAALAWASLAGCATDVTGVEAHRLVERGALLLDVRSREEYAEGHIEGSTNLPVEELGRRTAEVGPKQRTVVVYCHSGARAGAAVVILHRAGFQSVRNMGTQQRWYERSRPSAQSLF